MRRPYYIVALALLFGAVALLLLVPRSPTANVPQKTSNKDAAVSVNTTSDPTSDAAIQARISSAKLESMSQGDGSPSPLRLAPQILKLRFPAFRLRSSLQFSGLLAKLHLKDDVRAKFLALQDEKYWTIADLLSAAHSQGISDSSPEFSEMRHAALREIEEKLASLLGKSAFEEYVAYEASFQGRNLVRDIGGSLLTASAPLSIEQATELAALFTANSFNPPSRADAWIDGLVLGTSNTSALTLSDVHWDNILAKAPSFLSPEQIGVLNMLYAERAASMRADAHLAREMKKKN